MTKKLLLVCLLLICAAGISAQSLLGLWESKMKMDKTNMTIVLNMKDKENLSFTFNAKVHEENSMDLLFHVTVHGTYTLKDDVINLKLDQESIEAKVDDIKFYGEAAELAESNPQTAKFVSQMLESQIQESKGDFVKDIPAVGEMKILQLTDTTLKLESLDDDDNEIIEFTRQ